MLSKLSDLKIQEKKHSHSPKMALLKQVGILLREIQNLSLVPRVYGSMWRYPDSGPKIAVWPNSKHEINHHKHGRHRLGPFGYGIQKQTRLRVVDNSKIGMEAMELGRPPKVIHVSYYYFS